MNNDKICYQVDARGDDSLKIYNSKRQNLTFTWNDKILYNCDAEERYEYRGKCPLTITTLSATSILLLQDYKHKLVIQIDEDLEITVTRDSSKKFLELSIDKDNHLRYMYIESLCI